MSKVKIRDVKTKVIKEVEKSLASDYIGTKRFELVNESKEAKKLEKDYFEKEEK